MVVHHIFSSGCICISLWSGYGGLGGVNTFLMSEVTSLLLKFCQSFPKDQQTHPVCIVVFVIFIILFTVLRIYAMPLMVIYSFYDTATMWEYRGSVQNFLMWPFMTMGWLLICLQFFWYYLIWKKLYKIVKKIISP